MLVAALALSACGTSPDTAADPSAAATGAATQEDTMTKPTVTVPDGEPPTELVINDLIEGDGETLEPGGLATMHYVGVSYSTGEQFDASWDRGAPFTSTIPGQLIEGWNEGIPGMKVGGRRELIIPSELGYGEAGAAGGAIAPGETLIFIVDLLDVSN